MSELTRLSKSRFCAGLQCPKQLWWRVHEPDAPELEPGPELQAIFDRGNRVGEAAREGFPGGVLVEGEYWELREKVEQTRRALAEGAPVIYEASFSEDDVFVAVDVLERRRRGYRLVEVKSTLDVKEPHIPDVAIQVHVLRRAGLDVRRAEVMHLNRECHHPDLSNLFVREDVTREVKPLLPAIPGQVRGLQRMLAGPLPDTEPGDQCTSRTSARSWGAASPRLRRTTSRSFMVSAASASPSSSRRASGPSTIFPRASSSPPRRAGRSSASRQASWSSTTPSRPCRSTRSSRAGSAT
jgi:hypothetical protein